MSSQDMLDADEVVYTTAGADKELESDWEWTLTPPTDPNRLYGLYEPTKDAETIESVLLKEDGCLSDGRKPADINGIWFVGIPEGQPFHFVMFGGPPKELIAELLD